MIHREEWGARPVFLPCQGRLKNQCAGLGLEVKLLKHAVLNNAVQSTVETVK